MALENSGEITLARKCRAGNAVSQGIRSPAQYERDGRPVAGFERPASHENQHGDWLLGLFPAVGKHRSKVASRPAHGLDGLKVNFR